MVPPVQEESPPPAEEGAARVRILIAEDEVIVAMVLADCARKMGHHVVVVDDGGLALTRLSGGDVDVAILDLGIPVAPGDEVARQARAQDPRLTTVLMSGWTLAAEDVRLEPFDFLLQKPFDDRQARQTINKAVAMSHQRHADSAA